ncbi:MAG: hypothetical protein KF763_03350 [Cyclobacteriaceae bacterium]|nr:hypothetical protein [Cyclobacteriaceae bacterium]
MQSIKHLKNFVAASLPALLIGLFAISTLSFAESFDSNSITRGVQKNDLSEEHLTIAPAPVQHRQASLPDQTEPKTEEEEKESEDKNEKHLDAVNVPNVVPFIVRNSSAWLQNGQLLSWVAGSTQLYMLYHSWKIFH